MDKHEEAVVCWVFCMLNLFTFVVLFVCSSDSSCCKKVSLWVERDV